MRVSVVVIGAGPAGLAMSSRLTAKSIDHVVLERGEVAHSWHAERWDSLRLLTPNWMRRLPGSGYTGGDPDGFSTKDETIEFLGRYQKQIDAPLLPGVTVKGVRAADPGFEVVTDQGPWECEAVVAATGGMTEPRVPELSSALPPGIRQLNALEYRNPGQIDEGEVLVVGAAASGTQIAHELQVAGRQVTIAVGGHVRLPRTYRGRDIYWWMNEIGRLEERWDEVDDIGRARLVPSPQLTGTDDRRTLDLNALIDIGVEPVAKLMAVNGRRAQFSGSFANLVAGADLKQNRLLAEIDAHVAERGLDDVFGAATRPEPTRVATAATELDVSRFSTVIWATGNRPTWPWLDPAAFDHRRRVIHDGGVGAIPGLYFLGLPFLRRRLSSFIDGIGRDSGELVEHLHAHLDQLATHRESIPGVPGLSSSVRTPEKSVARAVNQLGQR